MGRGVTASASKAHALPMNSIYDMYIMLCLNSWFPLLSLKLTHERAKSLRQINSLDAEMYCLNSHKGRHARPRHGRVEEYTRPNHGRVDALYK